MAALTIKNIPDVVIQKLEAQAERHGRSLNAEVIHILASAVRPAPSESEALIARARALRSIPATVRITPRQLKAWKNVGRL